MFKAQQYQVRQGIKQQLKQGVPENELTRITITGKNKHQPEWENDKEFRYEGVMYDVVKKEIPDNNTIIYYCITDKAETTLFADLDEEVKKSMHTKNNRNNALKNLYKILSDIYSPIQKHMWPLYQTNKAITCTYLSNYSFPVFDILSPPPQEI